MTPEQWAQVAIENAVRDVGLRRAIAEVIRRALAEQRGEIADRFLIDAARPEPRPR